MRVLSVTSHGNGAGKTLLLERMLQAWPGRFGAVKFTTVYRDGKFCPRDAQARCACTKLHGEYQVITDAETLGQENTDTGRLLAAGASPLAWCLARETAHGEAWRHLGEILPDHLEILTEGNTALLTVPHDVMLFVVNPCMPRRFWKDNWEELLGRADVVVVNDAPEALGRRRPADQAGRDEAMAAVHECAPETPRIVARLDEPWSEWSGPLLDDLLAPPASSRSSTTTPD